MSQPHSEHQLEEAERWASKDSVLRWCAPPLRTVVEQQQPPGSSTLGTRQQSLTARHDVRCWR